jgi:hypothetical protein
MDTNLFVACLAVAFFAGGVFGYIAGCWENRPYPDIDETEQRVGRVG